MPDISVIVPVYKVEDYLDRCVESIVGQSYSNLEIILIDDGSPDRCPQLCDAWANKDERIRVIHKENGGVSSARNAGLKAASSEWIAFVDSDDWIHPQMFEILFEQSLFHKADIICVNNSRTKESEPFERIGSEDIHFSHMTLDDIFSNKNIRNYVWGKIYKSSFLKSYLFDESVSFGEDSLYNSILFTKKNMHLYYSDLKLYYYYDRENSAVNSVSPTDLIHLCEQYQSIAKVESREYPKSIYLMEAMKRALAGRYGIMLEADFKEGMDSCNRLLSSCAKELLRLAHVSIKNKIIFTSFSLSPQLYRFWRIKNDPSLLIYEEEKRKMVNR